MTDSTFKPGELVFTPTGGEARIVEVLTGVYEGRLKLAYLDALPGVDRHLELPARLVSRRAPVRVNDAGAVVALTEANRRRVMSTPGSRGPVVVRRRPDADEA